MIFKWVDYCEKHEVSKRVWIKNGFCKKIARTKL